MDNNTLLVLFATPTPPSTTPTATIDPLTFILFASGGQAAAATLPATILSAIKAALVASPALDASIAGDIGFAMPKPGSPPPYVVVTKSPSRAEVQTSRTTILASTLTVTAYAETPLMASISAQAAHDALDGQPLFWQGGVAARLILGPRDHGKVAGRGGNERIIYWESTGFTLRCIER